MFQSTTLAKTSYSCGLRGTLSLLLPQNCGTGFVGKLTSTGALTFLTYVGGSGQENAEEIGVDSLGNIWITGDTSSSDFPFSSDAYTQAFSPGNFDTPFLAEMSNDGSKLPFATPIASSFGQSANLKIDANNNVYVTGFSSGVPTTPNVYPADPAVYNPAFVQKWGAGPQPVLQLSSTSLTFPPTPYGGKSASQTVTAQSTGAGALELSVQLATTTYNATPPPGFVESDNCGVSLAAGASCTITVTFEPGAPSPTCLAANGCYTNSPTGLVIVQTNAAAGSQNIALAGSTGVGAAVSATPNPIVFSPQAAGTERGDGRDSTERWRCCADCRRRDDWRSERGGLPDIVHGYMCQSGAARA